MTLAERLSALPKPAIYSLAAATGALGSFSQAPFGWAACMLLMLSGGFFLFAHTNSARQAFALGWALAAGYFALTLRWIIEPFQIDAATHAWMAPFALAFLTAGLALIWGAAFALARWLSAGSWPLIFAWGAAEYFRAYAFTGFPWANPAQGMLESWAGQSLALVGPHGLTILALVLVSVVATRPNMSKAAVLVLVCVAMSVPPSLPDAPLTEHRIRLIQPNAPQNEKWDPELAHVFVERQVEMTRAPGDFDLAVWSEMAIPYRASVAGPVFEAVAKASAGQPVLMGAMRDDSNGEFFNAALQIGPNGQVVHSYDKHHLVPFGEYMPWPWLFHATGIRALADRTDTGYSPGPGPALMDFGELGKGLLLICYEAVFPQDLRGTARPDFLINITNDAWFGQGLGPQQHLALARMRAIEQGLPMIRVAGTGISAMIDPYGHILASIPLSTAGLLDAELPAPRVQTFYSRIGDWPFGVLFLLGLLVAGFRRLRH